MSRLLQQETPKLRTYDAFLAMLRQVFRLPTLNLDATEQYPRAWAAVLGGAGLGLVWGSGARTWMRLISTKPEFSIPGTAAILVIATVFGAGTGLAYAARRQGWRRWGHYVPRSLVVVFFIPFGMAEGVILMLTVLAATLAVTQRSVVGLWVLAVMAILLAVGTDIGVPLIAAGIALAGAVALTTWKLIVRRWRVGPRLLLVDGWLEWIMRIPLLLLALAGIGFIAREVVTGKPGVLGLLYVLVYLILLYPLFLALRVGLEPSASTGSRATFQSNRVLVQDQGTF
jgi:hypothetical protein